MKWLKRLFGKKKETITLEKNNLAEWIAKEKKRRIDARDEKMRVLWQTAKEEFTQIQEYVTALEETALQNPNISQREQNLLKGNKQQFITSIQRFLSRVTKKDTTVPLHKVEEHFIQLFERLEKPTQILHHFHAQEVKQIVQALQKTRKALVTASEDMRVLYQLRAIEKVEHMLAVEKEEQEQVNAIKAEVVQLQKQLRILQQEREKIKESQESLCATEEYNQYGALKNTYRERVQELRQVQQDIKSIFSPLDKVLKRAQYVSLHEEVLTTYINHPVEALQRDKNLQILTVLKDVSSMLEDRQIDVKTRVKVKSQRIIGTLHEALLRDLQQKHEKAQEQVFTLEKNLKKNSVQKEEELLNKKLRKKQKEIDHQEFLIMQAQKKQAGVKNEQDENLLLSLLDTITGKQVELV